MEYIPIKSRVSLESLLRVVRMTRIRLATDRDDRILRSKKDHSMSFLKEMHLGNNATLTGFAQVVRNIIMACYAARLASGQTLLCRFIKTCIIRKYLKAASDFSIPFQTMNPTMNLQAKESKFIKDILHEAYCWESMSKRSEPITKDMVSFVRNKGTFLSIQGNTYTVMSDWLTLGLQIELL